MPTLQELQDDQTRLERGGGGGGTEVEQRKECGREGGRNVLDNIETTIV